MEKYSFEYRKSSPALVLSSCVTAGHKTQLKEVKLWYLLCRDFLLAGKLPLDSICLWVRPSWSPKGSGRLGKEITMGMSLPHFTSDRGTLW